jgi:beta-phosphoglucomutase-like phosphatase (HAD superfamily)
MIQEFLREFDHKKDKVDQLEREHRRRFRHVIFPIKPLPGANQLMKYLFAARDPICNCDDGGRQPTSLLLKRLELPAGTPVVTGMIFLSGIPPRLFRVEGVLSDSTISQ